MATARKETKTDWVKMKPREIEKKVVELGKQNMPPEKIGLILRDQHGIPKTKFFGKKISQILKENNIYKNSELENFEKRIDKLKKHFKIHKHDYITQRRIVQYSSRVRKLKAQAKN